MTRHLLTDRDDTAKRNESADQFISIPSNYEVIVENANPVDERHFTDYLRHVWRHRSLVLLILIVCMAASFYIAGHITPIYTASALLRAGLKTPNIQPFQDPSDRSNMQQNPITTHMTIIQSPIIAEKVIEEAEYNPEINYDHSIFDKLASSITRIGASDRTTNPPGVATKDVLMQHRVAVFLSGLKVIPIPDTQILQIEYSSPDPDLSTRLVNSVCDTYVKYDFQSKSVTYSEAQRWLQEKLSDTKIKLAQSEDALFKFTGADGREYVMLSGDAQEYFKEMEELRLKIGTAEDDLKTRTLNLQKIESGGFPDDTARSGNTVIDQLRSQLAASQVDFDRIRQSNGPQDSLFKAAASARDRLAEQVSAEQKRILNNVHFDVEQSQEQLALLKQSYADRQHHVIDLQQRLSNYNTLKREVDVNRDLYNNLLQKWKEISVGQGVQPSDVTVLQRAEIPLIAGTKVYGKVLGLGLLGGLAVSIMAALFLEGMDNTLRNSEDIWRLSRLPTLGRIPKSTLLRRKLKPELNADYPEPAISESFRALRTSLAHSLNGGMPRSLLVTSSSRGEGKTMVAVNLAISLAKKGRKVLLVDGHTRNSQLDYFFGADNAVGLLRHLESDKDCTSIKDRIANPTQVSNLWITFCASTSSGSTSDLIDSERMMELMNCLIEAYDHVIIDSESILLSVDSAILASMTQGVVIVARPGNTTRNSFVEACSRLEAAGSTILGVVLNNPRKGVSNCATNLQNIHYSRFSKIRTSRLAGLPIDTDTGPQQPNNPIALADEAVKPTGCGFAKNGGNAGSFNV